MAIVSCLTRLKKEQDGSIAVEFAFIFPVLILIYIGVSILSDAAITTRKVNSLSYMISNIVAQEPAQDQVSSSPTPATAIAGSSLIDIFTGAQNVMYPKAASSLGITISAIDVTNNALSLCCVAKVRWSYTSNGILRPCNTYLTGTTSQQILPSQIPQTLLQNGISLPHPVYMIATDVSFNYIPLMGNALVGNIKMSKSNFTRPRQIGQVNLSSIPATGSQTGQICY